MKNGIPLLLAVLLSLSVTVKAFANHIFVGDGVEKVVTYDENGGKVITLIFDPVKVPKWAEDVAESSVEKSEESIETPEIGRTLGHILNENAGANAIGANRFTEAYRAGLSGQCTWYAAGRFREVHGIELPYMQSAKMWIENAERSEEIKAITDLEVVPMQSITVFAPTEEFKEWPGHVSFIEYVERDEGGRPVKIYYTDANGIGDLRKDVFDAGYDGTVKMCRFEEFKNPYGLRLIGYIVPNMKLKK